MPVKRLQFELVVWYTLVDGGISSKETLSDTGRFARSMAKNSPPSGSGDFSSVAGGVGKTGGTVSCGKL